MLNRLHSRKRVQLVLGYLMGIVFGFMLQKSGVAGYDVIMGQLLLRDFTVVKTMLAAVITGMAGVWILVAAGKARFHHKSGSLGSILPGGILFGAGFALLGYCPGTLAAAAGQGSLDAALAGIPGMIAGAWLYSVIYPLLGRRVLKFGDLGDRSLPEVLGVHPAVLVPVSMAVMAGLLLLIELGA